jgi:hypothetical protein
MALGVGELAAAAAAAAAAEGMEWDTERAWGEEGKRKGVGFERGREGKGRGRVMMWWSEDGAAKGDRTGIQ